ncbi:hypothetical protein MXD81_43450 [Microbacteriaceae bacterium K1510]|nr:hypothetical protein [Microbacteriaceae bacterium K1510]
MSANPGEWSHGEALRNARSATGEVSRRVRLAAIALRTIFMLILLAVTVRVSAPQSERLWSVYETPGDLVRLVLGIAVVLWIVIHMFMMPKDTGAYRTWLRLGPIAVLFALICAVGIW